MKARRIFSGFALLAVLVLGSAIAAFFNSERLDAVTVRFTGPGAEPKDVHIPGRDKDDVKPDYRLDIVRDRGRDSCGPIWDTSAAAGIRFVVPGDFPLRDARELVLVENDTVSDDDPVTRVAFAPPRMSANGFAFDVESSRSFALGLFWFLGTPVGLVIALVAILVLLCLLGSLARTALGYTSPQVPGGLEPPDIDLPDISP
ncbi:MAG TPA: hypothetical protein VF950_27260 [Planctomycetota bacterium]